MDAATRENNVTNLDASAHMFLHAVRTSQHAAQLVSHHSDCANCDSSHLASAQAIGGAKYTEPLSYTLRGRGCNDTRTCAAAT